MLLAVQQQLLLHPTDCSWLHAVVMCAVAYAQNPFDKVVGAVNDAAKQVTGVGDNIQALGCSQ